MKKTIIIIFIFLLFIGQLSLWGNFPEKELIELVNKMSTYVSEKKADLFMQLFHDPNVNFYQIYSEKFGKMLKEKYPDYLKIHPEFDREGIIIEPGKEVVASNKAQKKEILEKRLNVKIHCGEGVGVVFCDYIFMIGDEETGFGKEIISLIKTKRGWKIISLAYSMNSEG